MTQTVAIVSTLALIAALLWLLHRRATRDMLRIAVRLGSSTPGAHLIWDIFNTDIQPLTVTSFAINPRRVGEGRGESPATIRLGAAQTLQPGDHTQLSMDVDWRLLTARSIAACDAVGRAHQASASELEAIQAELRDLIDRPVSTASARDWLFGAANLAMGVVILGLGFVMLMWVIATG